MSDASPENNVPREEIKSNYAENNVKKRKVKKKKNNAGFGNDTTSNRNRGQKAFEVDFDYFTFSHSTLENPTYTVEEFVLQQETLENVNWKSPTPHQALGVKTTAATNNSTQPKPTRLKEKSSFK